eukprot:2020226-Rhodomonas_salina.1
MGEQAQPELDRPFTNSLCNDIWQVFAAQMIKGYDKLADIYILEPNLSNRNEAMSNIRLLPFWMDSENKEMDGLWKHCCFKQWKLRDLLASYCMFGSLFHYNIKHDGATGLITNCKVQLVVMGNRMKEGKDYVDSFTPVPHATSGRIVMSLAAAMDLELHSCDLAQAFIQADKCRTHPGLAGRCASEQSSSSLAAMKSWERIC